MAVHSSAQLQLANSKGSLCQCNSNVLPKLQCHSQNLYHFVMQCNAMQLAEDYGVQIVNCSGPLWSWNAQKTFIWRPRQSKLHCGGQYIKLKLHWKHLFCIICIIQHAAETILRAYFLTGITQHLGSCNKTVDLFVVSDFLHCKALCDHGIFFYKNKQKVAWNAHHGMNLLEWSTKSISQVWVEHWSKHR